MSIIQKQNQFYCIFVSLVNFNNLFCTMKTKRYAGLIEFTFSNTTGKWNTLVVCITFYMYLSNVLPIHYTVSNIGIYTNMCLLYYLCIQLVQPFEIVFTSLSRVLWFIFLQNINNIHTYIKPYSTSQSNNLSCTFVTSKLS